MGNELKNKILEYNGIISSESEKKKPVVSNCPRCDLTNAFENKYCSKCSYPLRPEVFDEIKIQENEKLDTLKQKYEQDIINLEDRMNTKLTQILSLIQQNPVLLNVKPEILENI